MGNSFYKRVNRAKPCLICGKPDWCSRTIDDSISFCARVTVGADRLSRKEGWGVFYHDRDLLKIPFWKKSEPRNLHKNQAPEIQPAPLEIRDFVYNFLLRISPATNYQLLINGTKGLRERGLKNFADYGGLPSSVSERKNLAAQVRLLLNQNFPDFGRQNPHGIRHIPGFWIDETGDANLWQSTDYPNPMLLVPYRNPTGRIQACQIRFTGKLSAKQKRYLWLSLPKMNSAGSGTPLHYAGWKNFRRKNYFDNPILITEGALKADVVANLDSRFFAIANSGVSCAQELIVSMSRGKDLFLAFDNDYHENPAVIRQLARLLKLRLIDCREHSLPNKTKILSWSRFIKGIDDALLNGEEFVELTIADWFEMLNEANRQEVRNIWD